MSLPGAASNTRAQWPKELMVKISPVESFVCARPSSSYSHFFIETGQRKTAEGPDGLPDSVLNSVEEITNSKVQHGMAGVR